MDSKAIEKHKSPFLPETYKELRDFVDIIATSDMVPQSHCNKDGTPKKGNLMACVIMGQSLGVPPMQAIQNICVINGMPSVWGDLALALVKTHPDCVDIIEEPIKDGWRCTSKRKGKKDVVREFTAEDAKKANLITKPGAWKEYPSRMLQMRARGFSIRDQFPDALRGLRIAEEIIDVTPNEPTETSADRLRRAKEEKENGTVRSKQTESAKPESNDSDTDAVVVLDTIMSQLKELDYQFSEKETSRLKEISTEDQIVKAIEYYEKKLVALRQGTAESEPPEDQPLPGDGEQK